MRPAGTRRFSLALATFLGACDPGTSPDLDATRGGNGDAPPRGAPFGKVIDVITATSPWGVAVRDDGLTYITDLQNARVAVGSTKTRSITGYIPTGLLPTDVAISPDGTRAFTANQADNSVTVIDVSTATAVTTVPLAASPFSVQVSPDGRFVFVGNSDNTLSVIRIGSFQVVQTIQAGTATNAFEVSPDGRRLYASHFVSGAVTEFDLSTGAILRSFAPGGTTQGLALNRKGTRLYVAGEAGVLFEIDLVTGAILAPIPIGGPAFGIGVTPDDKEAWITLPLSGQVRILNLQTRRLSATLDVGGEPRRVAFSVQGRIGAITNAAGYVTFVR